MWFRFVTKSHEHPKIKFRKFLHQKNVVNYRLIAFDFILDWLNKYLESFSFKTFCEKSNNFRFEKFEKFPNFKKFHIFVKNVIFWWKILIFKFSKESGDGRHPLSLSNVPAVSLSTSSRTSSWTSNDPSYKFLSSDMAIHATGTSREPWCRLPSGGLFKIS